MGTAPAPEEFQFPTETDRQPETGPSLKVAAIFPTSIVEGFDKGIGAAYQQGCQNTLLRLATLYVDRGKAILLGEKGPGVQHFTHGEILRVSFLSSFICT